MTREEQIEKARELLACGVLSKETCDAIKNDFPELRESEDERIRKAIESIIRVYGKTQGEWITGYDMDTLVIHLRNAFASLHIPETCKENTNSFTSKQKEQRPIPDWMPKFLDELRSKKNYFDWDEHRDIEGQIVAIINWIAPDYFKRKEEQKPAWSEEDEIDLNDAIKYVQNYGETSSDEYTRLRTKEIVERLKSIRHPFKDREMKLKILKYLSTRCSSLEFEEVEEYLNNLRPSWKPSEEQMEALERTTRLANFGLEEDRRKALVSLYEQLKAL